LSLEADYLLEAGQSLLRGSGDILGSQSPDQVEYGNRSFLAGAKKLSWPWAAGVEVCSALGAAATGAMSSQGPLKQKWKSPTILSNYLGLFR
jgi:hypothetical protein